MDDRSDAFVLSDRISAAESFSYGVPRSDGDSATFFTTDAVSSRPTVSILPSFPVTLKDNYYYVRDDYAYLETDDPTVGSVPTTMTVSEPTPSSPNVDNANNAYYYHDDDEVTNPQ